jgi:GDP-L-fucose synthase
MTIKVFVAGHLGLLGSAMVRRLAGDARYKLITATHAEIELADAPAVDAFFQRNQPEYVILSAGRVGGILENKSYPADFISANLAIQLNVLQAAHRTGVSKLLLFASSCMYPREAPQPMAESALFTGRPEPTSMAYAISKMAGMQLCLAYNQQYGGNRFLPLIPNSVYGPNDNFQPDKGHVLSALIRRFHDAKASGAGEVTLWGTGAPKREFLYADDLADACLFLLENDTSDLPQPINIGTGSDISIRDLATLVASTVGYEGKVRWDTDKPDGAPRKLLDSSRIHDFGWRSSTDLATGVAKTYQWYLQDLVRSGGSA